MVSDIPAGDGKLVNLFFTVYVVFILPSSKINCCAAINIHLFIYLVRHRHEAVLAVVESDQREEALEALEHGAVRPGVLVLGNGGVLGVGEELHEEEDEQVERLLVHGVQVDAADGDVLDVGCE